MSWSGFYADVLCWGLEISSCQAQPRKRGRILAWAPCQRVPSTVPSKIHFQSLCQFYFLIPKWQCQLVRDLVMLKFFFPSKIGFKIFFQFTLLVFTTFFNFKNQKSFGSKINGVSWWVFSHTLKFFCPIQIWFQLFIYLAK